jgi:hypothetical protein
MYINLEAGNHHSPMLKQKNILFNKLFGLGVNLICRPCNDIPSQQHELET